jgi:hypothetical protein
LRLEEDADFGMDRRNTKMMKAMNAPALNQQKLKDELLIEQLKEEFSK